MPPALTTQQLFSLWMVRLSCLLYFAALARWSVNPSQFPKRTWTAACLFYLLHMITAFAFFHNFSHTEAYEATARQTRQLMGVNYGGGLYWNYAFTAVWIADVLWAWLGNYTQRARWITSSTHAFLAFMFCNATVVFGKGWVRIAGATAFFALAVLYIARKRPAVGR
jgi:hypothetical protein